VHCFGFSDPVLDAFSAASAQSAKKSQTNICHASAFLANSVDWDPHNGDGGSDHDECGDSRRRRRRSQRGLRAERTRLIGHADQPRRENWPLHEPLVFGPLREYDYFRCSIGWAHGKYL
jgi:hypothetical protein